MESNVCQNIRRIIKDKGMLQKAVGEKAGFSEKVFSNMLAGRKVIRAEDMVVLAKVLEVTPNELFGYGKEI